MRYSIFAKRFGSGLLLLLCMALAQVAVAQTIIVGKVTDGVTNEEIIGAAVTEIDKTGRTISAAVTNINGDYSIGIKDKSNFLQVSYVGYKTVKIKIGNNTTLNFKLEDEKGVLDEVVVTASRNVGGDNTFGIPRREVSMAMGSLNMAELEGVSTASAEDALQGRISGLDIVGSGVPGSGSQMRIRGTSTITGNAQPLVVVNGVPLSFAIGSDFDFGTANDQEYADMLNVNVDDIEEITVLKDAASTALWGSQGANGVILITTKKGSRGRTSLNYSYKLSGQTQPKGMDMLSGPDYTMLMKQAFFNRTLGGNEQYSDYSFDELNYNYTSFPQAYNYDKDTDWVDAVTKHGWTHDHYLTLMGGGDRANYRLSAGYYDRTGTNLKQEYVRYSSRLQLDYNISDRIRASAEVQFTHSTNNKNYDDLLKIAYKKMPNMAIYEHDAQGNRTDRFFNITPGVGIGNTSGKFDSNQRNLMNPVALGYLAKHNVKGYRIIPKINLQYDIFDPSEIYLRLAGWVSIDLNHERTEKFLPAECVYNSAIDYTSANKGSTESVDKRNTSTEVSLTWQSRFYNPDMHRLQLQLKAQTSSSTESRQYIATQGLPSSEITSAVSKGRVVDTSNGNSTWHSVGWMGRMHYAFCNRYILDGNVRIDGSTQFGKDNRYGVFPGAAAKWLISDEPLFRKAFGTRVVTLLAPRISWGVSGRQPGRNYLQYSTLATNSYGYMDMSAVYPTRIRLDGLKWERVTSLNWGFDIELWDGLVSLNADFYKKRTKDLLFSNISIPSTSGFSTLTYKNVGSLDNYGWELTLNLYRFIKADKFSMDATFNLASNTNEIISLDPSVLNNYNNVENWGNGYYGARLQEGNSFGSIYGFRYKGVYSYSLSEIERAEAEGKSCAVARDGKGMVLTDADGKPKPMYYYYNSTKYQFRGCLLYTSPSPRDS